MILVTGGAGFIGRAYVKALAASGRSHIRVLDNLTRGQADDFPPEVEFICGDVRSLDAVRKALAGAITVYHMAAVNGTRNFYERPWDVLRTGIEGTLNVLQAAYEDDHVERIQFFSSSEVYQQPTRLPTPEDERAIVPDPRNPRYSYGGSKIAGELMTIHFAHTYGKAWQIIRPHNVYGPRMGDGHVVANLIDRIRSLAVNGHVEALPIQGTGQEMRSFCYIDDMVDGLMVATDKAPWNATYNVGASEEISIADLALTIADVMGVTVGRIEPSAAPAGETSRRCPDISALAAYGYKPSVTLREGIARSLR